MGYACKVLKRQIESPVDKYITKITNTVSIQHTRQVYTLQNGNNTGSVGSASTTIKYQSIVNFDSSYAATSSWSTTSGTNNSYSGYTYGYSVPAATTLNTGGWGSKGRVKAQISAMTTVIEFSDGTSISITNK